MKNSTSELGIILYLVFMNEGTLDPSITLQNVTASLFLPTQYIDIIFTFSIDEKAFVVLKIMNHRFYYMIDKRGEFLQPTLFDTTVGVKRWDL